MRFRLPFRSRPPRVSVVRLSGVIAADGRFGGGLSDQSTAPLIERAFARGKPDAVALVINSPGGSPVQSSLIAARVRRLAVEKSVPVYAFVEDVAASGGYWLASAADEIFVDPSSIVGSIGVISASFGFQEFIARHGIERRVHTAGSDKSFLDPFSPLQDADVRRLRALQGEIHEAFIAHVKARRGDRLADADLFNGVFWSGARAVELGLADGVGHLVPVLKAKFGDKVKLVVHTPRRSILRRFGNQVAGGAADAVEERLYWSRFGLP